jgi:uncharacterized membrane protein
MSGRKKPPRTQASAQVATRPRPQAPAKPDPISELAELLPGTAPVQERVAAVMRQTKFQGPIPHPDIFKGYGEVVPDAPERILRVFEQDSAHARDLQMGALKAAKDDNRRVHWMAWSLVAGGFGLSLAFAMLDKDWLAGILLGSTLVGIVTGFFSRNSQDKDPVKED